MKQKEFVEKILSAGGRVYIVGGYVRDLQRGAVPHDTDYCVTGIEREDFEELFSGAQSVGSSFPVWILDIDGKKCEVALARTERKNGRGYKGFLYETGKDISIEEDLYRRDTTINAMAIDLETDEFIDPFNGTEDINRKVISAVSLHFMDDPVRALRAARQAAVLGYAVSDRTIGMMHECMEELRLEPTERIVGELEKALAAARPSLYFRYLLKANLLDITYPEIHQLVGQTQPEEYHPEGDAFEHTMMVLDNVSDKTEDIKVRFAALFHDIGKGLTPKEELPKHHGHDKRGAEIIHGLPFQYRKDWKKAAAFVARHHMRIEKMKKKGKIIQFYEEMKRSSGLSMDDFLLIVKEDQGTKPNIPWFLDSRIMDATLGTKICVDSNMSVEQIKQKVMHERIRAMCQARYNLKGGD